MSRFIVCDAGGTPRLVSRFAVCDSTGVTRQVKRAFVGDASGVARLFYQGSLSLTLDSVSEFKSIEIGQTGRYTNYQSYGFGIGTSLFGTYGSISPAAVNGNSIIELQTQTTTQYTGATTYQTTLDIDFASDPGKGAFESIQVGSTLLLTSSATYQYANGVSTWGWAANVITAAGAIPVVINF